MFKVLRNLYNRPFQLSMRFRLFQCDFLFRCDYVAIDGDQFTVILYQVSSIVINGIIEHTDILEVCFGNWALCKLVIMKIENPHKREIWKFKRQIEKLIWREVQFDEWCTFVNCGYLVRTNFSSSQYEEFKTGWIFDEFTNLKVLL